MDVPETNQSTPQGTPQNTPTSKIDETFIADRQIFWSRFTNFTTGAVVAVAVLLIGLYLLFG
jgi:hypothetical protein